MHNVTIGLKCSPSKILVAKVRKTLFHRETDLNYK